MSYKSIITALSLGLALSANGASLSPSDWTDLCEELTSSILTQEELSALIDNNEQTEVVATFEKDETITFKLREDFKLFSYLIDGAKDKSKGPKAWTIDCSNDGETWTKFDSHTNQSYNESYWKLEYKKDPGNNEAREKIAAYRYVRFTFPAGNFGLSEIQLYGFPGQLIQGVTANGGVLWASNEGFKKATDGYDENYLFLVNDKITNKYDLNSKDFWVEYISPKSVTPESYALTSCVANSERDPKAWTFEGFNEETFTWEVLDKQENFKFTQRFSTIYFPVNTDKEYYRFRLHVTANNQSGNQTQFCKWHIFGAENEVDTRTHVACVGNSITENTALSWPEKYPSQLGQALGSDYRVFNYGISERTLLNSGNKPYTKELRYSQVLASNPDIVVIDLGTNDSKASNWDMKANFVSDYTELVKTFQALASQPKVFICKPLPAYSNNMNIRGDVIRDEICPLIDEVAAATGATVIDLYEALSGNESLLYDGVHPNAEGAAIMANVVANAINPTIEVPDDMYLTLAAFDWTDLGTASSAGIADADAMKAIDNDAATDVSLAAADGVATLVVKLEEGMKLTGYSVTSGSKPAAAPVAWTLQGSTDGSEWTDIESRSDLSFSHKAETKLVTRSLPDDRRTIPAYSWYRLVMTAADGQQSVNISEFQLLGFAENLVTDITGNGGTIKGQHAGYNANGYVETVDNLINDNINTKYCATGHYTGWVEYNAMQKVSLSGYAIVAAKDLQNRNPKSWTLEGSNDGENWETIDTRSDCEFLANHHTLRFDVNPGKSYERFRLNITENKGENNMQFSKWQLFGELEGQRKIRVACTGNSITANARLEEQDRYASILQRYLGDEYSVENFGVGGATIIKGSSYPYWDREAYKNALAFAPDILIAKFGTNDSNPANWTKKDRFVSDYVEYINSFKAVNPNVKVILCYPLTSWHSPNMPIVDKTVTEEIIPMIDEIAAQTGATIVDLHTPTEGKVYLTYDYVHPGVKGTTLMARHIAPAVNPEVVLPEVEAGYWQRVEEFDRTHYAITETDDLHALFDNDASTEVDLGQMTEGGIQIAFELPENFRTSGYAITWGNAYPSEAPSDWTLETSLDKVEWTTLDSRKNQVFLTPLETNMYQIDLDVNTSANAKNLVIGKYFRLTLKGNPDNNVVLSEFQLYGSNEVMKTTITGNGGTVTCSHKGWEDGNGYTEYAEHLFTDDITTKYCVTGQRSIWVQYESPVPVEIDRYSITNSFNYIGRNPKAWTLMGSNDGANWETLDSREDQSFMVRLNTVEYPVTADKAYKHYRLHVTENNGAADQDGGGVATQFSKWQLFKKGLITGVDTIEADAEHSDPIYNLGGVPVDETYKGIVVSKGAKRLAK